MSNLVDVRGHVAVDLPCVMCGYNLRSLASENPCPECGTPAKRSLTGDQLRLANVGWLRRLSHGVMLGWITLGVCALTQMIVTSFENEKKSSFIDILDPPWSRLHASVSLVPSSLGLITWLLIFMPEPQSVYQFNTRFVSHRRVARAGGALIYLLQVGFALTGAWPYWYWLVLGLVFYLTCISAGSYLGRLGARGGSAALGWQCRWVGLGCSLWGLSYVVIGVIGVMGVLELDWMVLSDEARSVIGTAIWIIMVASSVIGGLSLLCAFGLAFVITRNVADALKQAEEWGGRKVVNS